MRDVLGDEAALVQLATKRLKVVDHLLIERHHERVPVPLVDVVLREAIERLAAVDRRLHSVGRKDLGRTSVLTRVVDSQPSVLWARHHSAEIRNVQIVEAQLALARHDG